MQKYKIFLECIRANRKPLYYTCKIEAKSMKEAVNMAKNEAFLGTSINIREWKFKFGIEY